MNYSQSGLRCFNIVLHYGAVVVVFIQKAINKTNIPYQTLTFSNYSHKDYFINWIFSYLLWFSSNNYKNHDFGPLHWGVIIQPWSNGDFCRTFHPEEGSHIFSSPDRYQYLIAYPWAGVRQNMEAIKI